MLQEKIFGKLNSDSGDHDLDENDYRDCYDLIPIKDGASLTPRRQNVKGNKLIPSDTIGVSDETIGNYYDEKNNRVIFLNDHGNGRIGIYYYYPEDDTIVKRIDSDIFNLETLKNVSEIVVVGSYVIWKDDDDEIRQYNLDDEEQSFFTFDDKLIMLKRFQPWQPPWSDRISDSSLNTNKITSNSYQFAYQYIFDDESESVLSPLSMVNLADTTLRNYNDSEYNMIKMFIPIVNIDDLKHINLYYRKNDEDRYYLFERFKAWWQMSPTKDPVTGIARIAYFFYFTGGEAASAVSTEEIAKKAESIPWKTKSIVYTKNRLFMTRQVVNKELDNLDNFTFTAQALDQSNEREMYCMPGANYTVGLEFFNKDMNSTTVVKTADVDIPDVFSSALIYMDKTANYQLRVRLNGTVPSNFDYYRLLMTRNQKYTQWVQVVVNFMFFQEPYTEEHPLVGTDEFRDGDDVYMASYILTKAGGVGFEVSQIHLQMPMNMPFDIEPGKHHIRIISDYFDDIGHGADTFETESIHYIEGDKIVVGNFGKKDWSWCLYAPGGRLVYMIPFIVEIFVPSETVDGMFHEIGREFRIVEQGGNRVFEKTDITLEGDVRFFTPRAETMANWAYRYIEKTGYPVIIEEQNVRGFQQALTTTKKPLPESFRDLDHFKIISEHGKIYWLDYSKLASNRGRTNIDAAYIQIMAGHSIAFTRPLLTNTGLNGLNNVDADAFYDLDYEKGEVNKLVALHDNLIIAIHARSVTSMYIGESYIKQADGTDIRTVTQRVIGHHRPQQGDYGTINSESVVVADGKAYWWDAMRGCIVRYDNNGLNEISKAAQMKSFFKDVSEIIKPFRNSHKVIGEYHEFYDMIIWTFKPIIFEGNMVFAGMTIGYHVTAGDFKTKFRFLPERYCRIPQGIISFKNGKVYRHDKNSQYCTYYGDVHLPSITLVLNIFSSLDKIFENFKINSNTKLLLELTVGNQRTEIDETNYIERHNALYADIMRDMNTPNMLYPKITGDIMLGQVATLIVTTDQAKAVDYIEINSISYGHQLLEGHEIENKDKK